MKELFCSIVWMEVLLAVTFVFGVLHLITLTKLFDKHLDFITDALVIVTINDNHYGLFWKMINGIKKLWKAFGIWFFYFSLCFQAWYWLFRNTSNFN